MTTAQKAGTGVWSARDTPPVYYIYGGINDHDVRGPLQIC